MVPPDRADQCNHICLVYGKGPNGSIVMPLGGASNIGKVMCGHYLGQVGGHKPCEPEFGYVHMSPFGNVYCLATTVAVVAFCRHEATQDLAQRGVGRSGWESAMAVGRFRQNALVHPNGSARPGFHGVGTVC